MAQNFISGGLPPECAGTHAVQTQIPAHNVLNARLWLLHKLLLSFTSAE